MAWWSVGMDESARPFNKCGVEQPQAPPPPPTIFRPVEECLAFVTRGVWGGHSGNQEAG